MRKFEIGDKVRVLRDWTPDELYNEFVGKCYTIGKIDDESIYEVYLTPINLWFPEDVLEIAYQRVDQCSITIKKIGDGSCLLGSMGITEDEFNELWEKFIK